ncbi:MAG: polysaccharide pyruvyl transferase family protein [Oscillochloridaceae bacterium]|nr:polysaccharide pyruvyl transferase family protein [Chloroflexaceae bacterium]MDW8389026.1 polysaccharide pyruvyl transferase family protein [Oscillochloridaceae bacterium]
MRIVILNTYSWLNKGDAAIVLGTVRAVRAVAPEADITLVSLTPEIDRPRYAAENLRVVAGPFGLLYAAHIPVAARIGRFASEYLALLGALLASRLTRRSLPRRWSAGLRDLANAIAGADVAISCGGGFWQDSWGPGVLVHVAQVMAALAAGVPVVCLGQSVGPFRSALLRSLVGHVLRRADAVVIRESESLATIQAMRIAPERLHFGADMAFALDRDRPARHVSMPRSGRLRVGVTARNWSFPHSLDRQAAQRHYEDALVEALAHLLAVHDAEIVFLPQVIGPGNDDDRLVERRLAARLKRPDRVRVIADDLAPSELIEMLGGMDMLLATRFHSAIFAMLARVPVVAIAYEHKTTGIMRRMDLGQWIVPIETVSGARLIELIEAQLAQRETVIATLNAGVAQERARALASAAICQRIARQRAVADRAAVATE